MLGGGLSNVDAPYENVAELLPGHVFSDGARRRSRATGMATRPACAAPPGCGRRMGTRRCAQTRHDPGMVAPRFLTAVLCSVALLPLACSQPAVTPSLSLDEVIRQARADAARRTQLAPESLELIGAETVTWRDGSLGCPQPGMAYTQALVPGWRVRLRGPAGVLDYHASLRGGFLWCPPGRAVEPLPGDHRT